MKQGHDWPKLHEVTNVTGKREPHDQGYSFGVRMKQTIPVEILWREIFPYYS